MSAVIDAMWRQLEPTVYISREQFECDLADWTVEAVEIDGALAGAIVTRGPELHFATFGHVPISMRMVRERVQPLIDEYGYCRTRTPKDATRQRRFNEMIGFRVEGEDEFFLYYRTEHLRPGRQRCPS